jgi:hypothetical protein
MIRRILPAIFIMLLFTLTSSAEEKRIAVPIGDSPLMGPAQAPVTIIEFLDFQ